MKHLKIRTKMALLLSILLLAVAVIGISSLKELNDQGQQSLSTIEQQARDNFDDNIKQQVQSACSMLQEVYNQHLAGVYTLDQAKKVGADLLREMRFGEDGYFWADNYAGLDVYKRQVQTAQPLHVTNLLLPETALPLRFVWIVKSWSSSPFRMTPASALPSTAKRQRCSKWTTA